MVENRCPSIAGLTIALIILCQLPSYRTDNVQKSSRAKLPVLPNRRIAPLSSSDLLAAQLLKESPSLKRPVRKLQSDGASDASVLDAVNPDEYQGVVGRPGVDFPVLSNIPVTNFSCKKYKSPGYYADLDTNCQVFHICDGGRKVSFLCPNGTIFRQSDLICDWWFRVDCGNSINLYEESAEQLAVDQKFYREKSKSQGKESETSNFQSDSNSRDAYSSKVKASGNQPLQQNTFPYQPNQNQKQYNSYEQAQFSEVTPSPNNYYPAQNPFQAHNAESQFPAGSDIFSGKSLASKQKSAQSIPLPQPNTVNSSNSKSYSGGNSLDSESQVLAESVNYGTGKQNRYKAESYYNLDGTPKQYTSYEQSKYLASSYNQQIGNNPKTSTTNNYVQPSTSQSFDYSSSTLAQQSRDYTKSTTPQQTTNYAKSTTQQSNSYNQPSNVQEHYSQSNTAQQIDNYPTTIQQTNYPQSSTSQKSNTVSQSTTAQQISSYPLGSTTLQANSYSQPSTLQQNDAYQGSTNFYQGSTNIPQSTNYQGSTNLYQGSTNIPQSTYYQGSTNLYQGSTNIPQSTYYQGRTNLYQGSTNIPQSTTYQPDTYQPDTTYQQRTTADILRSKDLSSGGASPSTVTYSPTNYVSYTTPTYQESSTPTYSTFTSRDFYPTTVSYNPTTLYSTFSSIPTTNPELFSTVNFNRNSLGQSNLVPEPINNALEENSNGDVGNQIDSISIYYDQINNKESVRLPLNNQDTKNKISVSDISLNQNGQVSPGSFDVSNALPSVLTDSTKEGYSILFSNRSQYDSITTGNNQGFDDTVNKGNNQEIPRYENDLALQENQGFIQASHSVVPTTTASPARTSTSDSQKDLELRHSSDLRELAQVFSRALSAYLEDPENFRRILSEVRPTEPNTKTTTANPHKNEVLEFSEDIKFSPPKSASSTPTVYPTVGSSTLGEQFRTSSIANQVNNLATDTSYLSNSRNLYGGFQNNSASYSPEPKNLNVFEGTAQTYFSVSPFVDVTRGSTARKVNLPTTPIPVTLTASNSNAIGAQEVNNLAPSKNYGDDVYDKNNVFNSDTYDYSFGANAKDPSQFIEADNLESLVPYDSQSIVSKDNLIRLQNAQQKYYANFKYGQVENFSKAPETYQPSLSNGVIGTSTPSIIPNYYSFNEPSSSFSQSTYSPVNFVSTEAPSFYQSSIPYFETPFVPQVQNTSMYKEAKEMFGNLNETSASILMNMMHEAETNSTLGRLVLLLVNDKSGNKTPEESRNKLLEALLQMPQRVPGYPPSSSRTFTPKLPRRVKVLKSRMLASEKSSTQSSLKPKETSTKASSSKETNTKTTSNIRTDPLLAENLSSESDTRAVELLKSLYVLAAKWG